MKINFNLRNIVFIVFLVLGVVGFIGAIVTNSNPMYQLTGFAWFVITLIINLAIGALLLLNIVKVKLIKDILLVVMMVLTAVCLGNLISDCAYAYGATVFTKVESDNPYLVRLWENGLFTSIFYIISLVVGVVVAFLPEKAEEKQN